MKLKPVTTNSRIASAESPALHLVLPLR